MSEQSIDAELFVRTWQSSSSVHEVCATLGIDKPNACNRAYRYRRKGIPLKRMPGSGAHNRIDVASLVAIVKASK